MSESSSKSIGFGERAIDASVIVCERSGDWALALKREPAFAGIALRQTRSLRQCQELLAEAAECFVIAELAGDPALLLAWAMQLARERPAVRLAVVADRSLAEYEEAVREAGVVLFLTSPRELHRIAPAVRNYFRRFPPPQRSLREEIWRRLPWGER